MNAFLNIQTGPDAGKRFALDPTRPMHLGRGASCEILLSDPLASRFHAVIFFDEDHWQIRDTQSRNGVLVNGQKTDHATLMNHAVVQVGGTELHLVQADQQIPLEDSLTQTVQLDYKITDIDFSGPDAAGRFAPVDQTDPERLHDLYRFSLDLLRADKAQDVCQKAGQLLAIRTGADAIGFLWESVDGRLTTERVFPPEAQDPVRLSRTLTKRVLKNQEAIWIKERPEIRGGTGVYDTWSDAICVPMPAGQTVLGVLHLYRRRSRFEAKDFDFTVAAGRLLAAALAKIRQAQSLQNDHQRLAESNAHGDELIGQSRPMLKLKERIGRVGKANGSVLIRGESGTGKELVARAVHRGSPRASRPLLCVNCAAIPSELMESQLFGHRKGAFTGAEKDHIGWFEQAHTGTLFLDEIGELTLDGQAKLLRILEGHPFLPVGAVKEVTADVRVVAATNRDLAEFVREKRFREDLYYRLSVFELLVPPLRDRNEDIERLIDHFFDHFRRQHGRPQLTLSSEAREAMLRYPWPGNVRQLRNVIDSAVVMADDAVQAEDLGMRDTGNSQLETLRIDVWEKRLIRKALQRTDQNVAEAAKLLGVSRATLYRKISEHDLQR